VIVILIYHRHKSIEMESLNLSLDSANSFIANSGRYFYGLFTTLLWLFLIGLRLNMLKRSVESLETDYDLNDGVNLLKGRYFWPGSSD
jgi:hypothetical protein